MKAEEIKNKTNEAVASLVEALESVHSEGLTEYLNAMARFHSYCFGNIMLISLARGLRQLGLPEFALGTRWAAFAH
jgi:hypothetical protein